METLNPTHSFNQSLTHCEYFAEGLEFSRLECWSRDDSRPGIRSIGHSLKGQSPGLGLLSHLRE